MYFLVIVCVFWLSLAYAQNNLLLTLSPVFAAGTVCPQLDSGENPADNDTCTSGAQTVIWQGQEWQRCDDGNMYTWEDAKTYCRDLVLDGHCDWRLPGYEELKSLVVCSNGTSTPLQNYPDHPYFCGDGNSTAYNSPTIDDSFSCLPWYYWSDTTDNEAEAWALHFGVGGSRNWPIRTFELSVRCVRIGGNF